jgi:hypothetical protein
MKGISNAAGVITGKHKQHFKGLYSKNNADVRVNQEYDCKIFFLLI